MESRRLANGEGWQENRQVAEITLTLADRATVPRVRSRAVVMEVAR